MKRVILAVVIALAFGAPALNGALWQVGPLAPCLFALNLPGIIAAIPHLPPEGYPGQSVPHAIAMLLIQIVVWYILLSVFAFVRSRFIRNHT
jgi:hypothetical protein